VSEKPIPEKTQEMVFARYFLQSCGMRKVWLYAPSTVEEAIEGYDSKMIGANSFWELRLQFKAPTYKMRERLFRIEIDTEQHKTLQQHCKPDSAYYVTHLFRSLAELREAEQQVRNSAELLLNFVAIEISHLPSTTVGSRTILRYCIMVPMVWSCRKGWSHDSTH
jgi:hypothetical protein